MHISSNNYILERSNIFSQFYTYTIISNQEVMGCTVY